MTHIHTSLMKYNIKKDHTYSYDHIIRTVNSTTILVQRNIINLNIFKLKT